MKTQEKTKAKKKKKTIAKRQIDGPLTIYQVGEIQERMIAALENNNGIELDLQNITECDMAGVQLLCSLKKSADKKDNRMIMSGVSQPVKDAFSRAGMNLDMIYGFTEGKDVKGYHDGG